MKHKLIIFLFLLCLLPSAGLAQKTVIKGLVKAGEKAVQQTERRVIRNPGNQTRLAKFAQQNKKAMYWTQTRILRISPKQALRNLERLGVVPTFRGPRPVLEKRGFIVKNFKKFATISPYISQPPAFPFHKSTLLIFRGLSLPTDGKAIENILQNGLRVKDVGPNANTLLRAYAGAIGGRAVQTVNTPVINLSGDPQIAADWAHRRLTSDHLAVVVVVKSKLRGDLILDYNDIPAADIYAVSALLNINGTLRWCKLQLNPAGGFRVTPYAKSASISVKQ